jgi:16S rRNA C1402 (ribose-2'-O) methylase RsmI
MLYFLIGLSLSLAGLSIMQFLYLIYLERMGKSQKKRINELESHNRYLAHRLEDAEQQINEQNTLIDIFYEEFENSEEEEVWADVIDEK